MINSPRLRNVVASASCTDEDVPALTADDVREALAKSADGANELLRLLDKTHRLTPESAALVLR